MTHLVDTTEKVVFHILSTNSQIIEFQQKFNIFYWLT